MAKKPAKKVELTSGQELFDSIYLLADSGASIIQVRTREPIRAALTLRGEFATKGIPYYEWDVVNGVREFTTENFVDHTREGNRNDFGEALSSILSMLRDPSSMLLAAPETVHYFAFICPQVFIEGDPRVLEYIQQYASLLPAHNACILFITDDNPISGVPLGYMVTTSLATPFRGELERITKSMLECATGYAQEPQVTDEEIAQLAQLGIGLTAGEFESCLAITIVEGSVSGEEFVSFDLLAEGVRKGKTEVVKQSEILELTQPGDISDVGGMSNLKEWLEKRKECYTDEAKDFGIKAPKGIALVGVPGTGKSLVAKAISSVFQVPLVRLDFSRVFSKYVGDSESRVRAALEMVESMAPCVLFVDEIDKGLGGAAGGGGDSGTSSRVLGSFLTWLAENQKPVFTMVTANRVDGLPPELLRRGRFDQIFSVGLPGSSDRVEVLDIHMRKRGRTMDEVMTKEDIARFIKASEGYVPAEIESALGDALVEAFHGGDALSADHIIDALADLVPLSRSNAAKVAEIVDWARNNAIDVNGEKKIPLPTRTPAASRRLGTRARGTGV